MSWLKEIVRPKIATKKKKDDIPSKLWIKCDECKEMLYSRDVEDNLWICPSCGFHMKISSEFRFNYLFDKDSINELPKPKIKVDPLNFKDRMKYTDRLKEHKEKTGLEEAIRTFTAKMNGIEMVVCCMDFRFIAGSMGMYVGESVILASEYAMEKELPLLAITTSGGARMQEGILSLMQMARTTAAIKKLKEKDLGYFVLLTDPTTGGVTASFAMIGDVIMAEPGAMIGFAGRRIIEQTIGEKLPDRYQSAEYLEEKGMVDLIIDRHHQKDQISKLIKMLCLKKGNK